MADASISRRALLASAASAVGAHTLSRLGHAQVPAPAPHTVVPPDPTKLPGSPPSQLGQRSAFERPRRIPLGSGSSLAPLQDLVGILTPADLHFERHHNGVACWCALADRELPGELRLRRVVFNGGPGDRLRSVEEHDIDGSLDQQLQREFRLTVEFRCRSGW